MKNIIQSILSSLAWSGVILFGLSVLGLWSLFQNDLAQYLLALQSRAISALGWTSAILILLWSGTAAYAIYLHRRISDPFKKYPIDDKTETAIDQKTGRRYCPNCLVNRTKSAMILKDDEYLCVNRSCPNSKGSVKVAGAVVHHRLDEGIRRRIVGT